MSSKNGKKVFLTADWRRLISANYVVSPEIMWKHVPEGTELELFNGQCFVSLVAFRYSDTRLLSVRVPFHTMFEEINLRFYVRRKIAPNQWRSEVAFTRLFFPKRALTMVAKQIYKENYQTFKMKHFWSEVDDKLKVSYALKKDSWHSFDVTSEKEPEKIKPDSYEDFFSKQFWGTSQIDSKSCTIYEIEHPEWHTHRVIDWNVSFDFGEVFGPEFKHLSGEKPHSVHLFDGSEVIVNKRAIIQ